MATLKIVASSRAPRHHPLTAHDTVIGRHFDCDVVLPDTTVSRRHARISWDRGHFFLEDLGSQHGTLLNGKLIRGRKQLRHLDQIQIRETVFIFCETAIATELEPPFAGEARESSSTIVETLDAIRLTRVQNEGNPTEKLSALLEITRNLGVSLNVADIFPKILESVFRIFPAASRGCIFLAGRPDGAIIPRAVKYADDDDDQPPPVSRAIAQKVMSEGKAILSADAGADTRFIASESVANLKIRSVMCAPLIGSAHKPLGMIQIDTRRGQFSAADLDVLVNVANLAGQAVAHARLHKSQLKYDRRERDMKVAEQVQLHFLPRQRPHVPGYQFHDHYQAAERIGGDYFGYVNLLDGRLAIAVGDVAGKGISAALLMARLCSDVRYCLATTPTPAAAVQALNLQIHDQVAYGRFVTFAMCVLDPARHELVLVNAGQMPPILRRANRGSAQPIGEEMSGPPLGVATETQYRPCSLALEPGDAVILYTDGVNEARNLQRRMYGSERVLELTATRHDSGTIVQTIWDDLQQFTQGAAQNDDICILCVSRDGASSAAS